jgi:uncharacterized protein YjbI with pentapeptide repeats
MFRGRSLKLPAAAFILMLAVGTTGAFSPAAAYDPTDLVQLKVNRDCAGCDLSAADLFLADLTGANLAGANLSGADLRGADMRGASLDEANTTGAKLDNATLTGPGQVLRNLF